MWVTPATGTGQFGQCIGAGGGEIGLLDHGLQAREAVVVVMVVGQQQHVLESN